MKSFLQKDFAVAMEILKVNSTIASSSIDTLQVTVSEQMKQVNPVYGNMLSYDLVAERKIKDFIVKRIYILRFERAFLEFDFSLYNNGKRWAITSFKYNEDLSENLFD